MVISRSKFCQCQQKLYQQIEHLKWDLTAKTQIEIIWTKFLIIDHIWCRFSVTDEKKDPTIRLDQEYLVSKY